MADERARHELLAALSEVLGPEQAATLMENLPPQPWHHLATKADLERFATKADLERFATKADLERFATKADLERFATKDDLAQLREVMDLRFTAHSAQFEALLRERLDAQTKLVVFAVLGAVLSTAGIAFGSAVV